MQPQVVASGSRKSSSKGSRNGRASAEKAQPAGHPFLSAADATQPNAMMTPSVFSSPAPQSTIMGRGVVSGVGSQHLQQQQHITTTTTTTGNQHLLSHEQQNFRQQGSASRQLQMVSSTEARGISTYSGGQMIIASSPSVRDGTEKVISERFIEHEIKVPKRVLREDVIEKFVIVPEKVVREEIVDDIVRVKEKIIEVAKPVIQEKIVEVPEYEYVERIVEVPEKVYQEKIREVPTIQYEERVVEVPRVVTQEKIVEVPQIEYRDVPVQKIVEVPEIEERIVVKEVQVPQYIEKPTPEYVEVEVAQEVEHNVPVPVEAVTKFGYRLPKLQPRYNQVDITLYVPRFVEVPVPAEFMDDGHRQQAEQFAAQVNILANQKAAGLGEVESLAGAIKSADFGGVFSGKDQTQVLSSAWGLGKLGVGGQQHQRQIPGMYAGGMGMQTLPLMGTTAASHPPMSAPVGQQVGRMPMPTM